MAQDSKMRGPKPDADKGPIPDRGTNSETSADKDYGGPLFHAPGVNTPQKKAASRRNEGRLGRALQKDEKTSQ
jgi:hypothetical protein